MQLAVLMAIIMLAVCGDVEARERPIEDLPKDAWDLAFVWTEPLKQAAKETRRFDPLSGLWFGLLEGSVKAVERTAEFFFQRDEPTGSTRPAPSEQPLIRYSF